MSYRKKSLGGSFKNIIVRLTIVAVVLFQSLLSSILIHPQTVNAADYSSKLNFDNPDPSTSQEYGIWIDRATIALYKSSEEFTGEIEDGDFGNQILNAPNEEGLNDGTIVYKSGCQELTVRRTSVQASTDFGTLKKCDGSEVNVGIFNGDNAKIDGYYENDTRITMPRYVGGIDDCSLNASSWTNKYRDEGEFEKEGSEFQEPGNDGANSKTYINEIAGRSGGRIKTAKQRQKSTNQVAGQTIANCTAGYAEDGNDAGRTIYLLNGFTYEDVENAAKAKIDSFNSERGKIKLLENYFNESEAGRAAIETCKRDTSTTGNRSQIINLLVNSPAGSNPFVECMLTLLGDDPDFMNALEYEYQGEFESNVIAPNDEDCADSAIPLLSDVSCWLVKWLFDALHSGFGAVIEHLATPPDMFEQQNSTLEQSIDNLKTVANLIFVLAFLFVVFQYMTNINVVDAYFVKKFVPRLVIAVVLVQASFFIVSELNYFFFDLGSSIQTIVFRDTNESNLVVQNGAGTIATVIILGPAVIALFAVIGIILLLVLLITIIVLTIRYILIIVLAILAPVAFAALAIPQLEGMTKKWFNMYIKLLLMYPIIMFFLAASAVVGGALSGGGVLLQIIAIIAAFVPFFILPFTFKFAGGVMGTVAAKINGLAKKGGKMAWNNSGAKADLDKYKGMRKQNKDNKSDERVARRLESMKSGDTRRGRLARRGLMRGVGDDKLDTYAGGFEDRVTKRRQDEAAAQINQGVKGALTGGHTGTHGTFGAGADARTSYLRSVLEDKKSSTEQRQAAFEQLLATDSGKLGEVEDEMNGAGLGAEFSGLVNNNYKDVASVRADVAGRVSGKGVWATANTAEKLSGQKGEVWESMASENALAAMSAHDTTRADKTYGGKVINVGDFADNAAKGISKNTAQLDGLSTAQLQSMYDKLEAGHAHRTASGGDTANVEAAMHEILGRI